MSGRLDPGDSSHDKSASGPDAVLRRMIWLQPKGAVGGLAVGQSLWGHNPPNTRRYGGY